MRFKIDWANLIAGNISTIFALFYFIFEGNFPSTSPRGAYIWRGDLTEGFLRYRFGGIIFGGAYTWRGLFSEFYGISGTLTGQNTHRNHVNFSCTSASASSDTHGQKMYKMSASPQEQTNEWCRISQL